MLAVFLSAFLPFFLSFFIILTYYYRGADKSLARPD